MTPGAKFREAVAAEKPLKVVGAITAYAARMAQAVGFKALYLSGGGVAANSLGMPDLGISTLDDVLIDARRITEASSLPLLVDADTGWGGAFHITRPRARPSPIPRTSASPRSTPRRSSPPLAWRSTCSAARRTGR